MKKLNYAVIGYGFIGRRHVDTLRSLNGFDCTAVADINPARLNEAKKAYPDLLLFSSIDPLLSEAEIDGVIISANNNQHKELAIKATKAGKHIICEKPAALSVAEFDEMTAAAKEAGVTFTVHQQRRFDKDFRTVKEVYDKKLVGNTYLIKSSLYGYNGNMHDWHIYKSEGGGMLYDWGVHLLDQILYMIDGRILSVFADVRNVINKEVDDYFSIILKFENGVTAQIELGTYFLSDRNDWFERHWYVGGDKGSMYCDKFAPEGKIIKTSRLLENVAEDQEKSAVSYGPTRSFGVPEPGLIISEEIPKSTAEHVDYFKNYLATITGSGEFLVKIPEVRRVLALMEAVRLSAETNKSVALE